MLKIATGEWGTILGFEFGSFGPLWVREETFRWGLPRPVSVLYASDLHAGHWWTRPVFGQIVDAVRQLRPDVLLLGGDLVDAPSALPQFSDFIRTLASVTIVAGIPGNHDDSAVGDVFRSVGGHWLLDKPLLEPIAIDGAIRTAPGRGGILCAHYPSDFPNAARAGYRLTLAGHLHGGQCVLARRGELLYPAVWFQRWHGLKFEDGTATMLVSRGVGDTLPLRHRCPRELLLCRFE